MPSSGVMRLHRDMDHHYAIVICRVIQPLIQQVFFSPLLVMTGKMATNTHLVGFRFNMADEDTTHDLCLDAHIVSQ